MKPSMTRVRVLAAGGILILSLAFVPALPAAERPSNAGQLLFWLLGLQMAREQGRPSSKPLDLVRAGLSQHLIERLAASLTVDPDWPSALAGPPRVPHRR
jgi:hypothetical protein